MPENNIKVDNFLNTAGLTYLWEKMVSTVDDQIKTLYDNTRLTKITYLELIDSIDKKELIPGKKYRITDYNTTTSSYLTKSAGHQFDIIVEALTTNTLNENAKACKHDGDTYFNNSKLECWELKYSVYNDDSKFKWVSNKITLTQIPIRYMEVIDSDENNKIYRESLDDYFISFGYENDNNGTECLVLYKTDILEYPNDVDYEDRYFYCGTAEIENKQFDRWRKIDLDFTFNSEKQKYFYTDLIVENNTTIKSEYIRNINATGVIYYMKDEYNNEAPYDFKNIKMKRNKLELHNDNTLLNFYSYPINISNTEDYFYTFSNVINNEIKDASIISYSNCHNNIIKPCFDEYGTQYLNTIYFIGDTFYNNEFGLNNKNIIVGDNTINIKTDCNCEYIDFGKNCNNIKLGNKIKYLKFADNSSNSYFKGNAGNILFCSEDIKELMPISGVTVGYNNCSKDNIQPSIMYITSTSKQSIINNLNIRNGINVNNTSIVVNLEDKTGNHETTIAKTTDGTINIYCEADKININNSTNINITDSDNDGINELVFLNGANINSENEHELIITDEISDKILYIDDNLTNNLSILT